MKRGNRCDSWGRAQFRVDRYQGVYDLAVHIVFSKMATNDIYQRGVYLEKWIIVLKQSLYNSNSRTRSKIFHQNLVSVQGKTTRQNSHLDLAGHSLDLLFGFYLLLKLVAYFFLKISLLSNFRFHRL